MKRRQLTSLGSVLSQIPSGLRGPLLEEYRNIVNSYCESKWRPSELSGGRFCEIVYTIIDGYAEGKYAATPSKPKDFTAACRAIENNTGLPRSFRILVPRLLSAIYEIRNSRDVGHVGGDVNPDFMDSSVILSASNWIMAELTRVFHNLTTSDAQQVVDDLVEKRVHLVWKHEDKRRVLVPSIPLKHQIVLLLGSSADRVDVEQLFLWTDYRNRSYFNKCLNELHDKRIMELDRSDNSCMLLPPGRNVLSEIIEKNE